MQNRQAAATFFARDRLLQPHASEHENGAYVALGPWKISRIRRRRKPWRNPLHSTVRRGDAGGSPARLDWSLTTVPGDTPRRPVPIDQAVGGYRHARRGGGSSCRACRKLPVRPSGGFLLA